MLEDLPDSGRKTLGGDKNYDTRDFVRETRELSVTTEVAFSVACQIAFIPCSV